MAQRKKIRLLDLCCKAGGCSVGYHQAAIELGYDIQIIGVDNEPQPNYPYKFVQADAVKYLAKNYHKFTHIHASPPCQKYSVTTKSVQKNNPEVEYSAIAEEIRDFLHTIQVPSVIENVLQAPIRKDIVLNGDMFGLKVLRSRKFELNNFFMMQPLKPKKLGTVKSGDYATVVGNGRLKANDGVKFKVPGNNIIEVWSNAMDIHWMKTRDELKEAIPPAYTKYIGYEFFKVNTMISPKEKAMIKQYVGAQYSGLLIALFNEKKIAPAQSDKWTPRMVNNLLNGFLRHPEAEMAVLQFAVEKKSQKEKENRERQELIDQL